MRLTISFDERQLVRYLGRGQQRWPQAASRALEKIGRAVYDESDREVPKGTSGVLRSSRRMSIDPHTVLITYSAPYARIVHFRRHVHHREGKSFFLTTPLGRGKRLLGASIQAEVQREMDHTPTD